MALQLSEIYIIASKICLASMKLCVLLVLTIISVWYNMADSTAICQPVNSTINLNVTRYFSGYWYVKRFRLGNVASQLKISRHCVSIAGNANGTNIEEAVHHSQFSGVNRSDVRKVTVYSNGRYTAKNMTASRGRDCAIGTEYNVTVIATDYNRFALIHVCVSDGIMHFESHMDLFFFLFRNSTVKTDNSTLSQPENRVLARKLTKEFDDANLALREFSYTLIDGCRNGEDKLDTCLRRHDKHKK